MRTRFVGAGQPQMVFRIAKTPENQRLWDLLDKAQDKWDIEYCHCSVFDDCWEVKGKFSEPKPADQCTRDEPHEFMP